MRVVQSQANHLSASSFEEESAAQIPDCHLQTPTISKEADLWSSSPFSLGRCASWGRSSAQSADWGPYSRMWKPPTTTDLAGPDYATDREWQQNKKRCAGPMTHLNSGNLRRGQSLLTQIPQIISTVTRQRPSCPGM